MKIVHVVRYGSVKGGAETYVAALSSALRDLGHEVSLVYAMDPDVSRPEVVAGAHVPSMLDPSDDGSALRTALRRLQPDVIHSHIPDRPTVNEMCREVAGTLLAVHDHVLDCPVGTRYLAGWRQQCTVDAGLRCLGFNLVAHCGSLRANITLKPYRRWRRSLGAVRQTPVPIQVFSEHMAARLTPMIGRDPYVTPYPTPPAIATERPSVKEVSDLLLAPEVSLGGAARASVERETRPVVFASGRLNREKGFRQLIEAMPFVEEGCHLVIAGEGHDRPKLEKLAASTIGGHRITFTGWLDHQERSRWLERATLVAVPSMWPEPFGIVGLEAMAAGKPVVAFDSGGIPTWLEDGVTGILVAHADLRGLAAAITRLLQDRAWAETLGLAGQQAATGRFALRDHAARMLDIYEETRG